jgi:putative restriction endonuclease
MMSRRNWQREELLLALNLYCRLPFGQYHNRNPEIIKLAGFIERSPDAVAMKLSNFASLDPYHQSRGIKGLSNVSQSDIAIWEEFNASWSDLAAESETIYTELAGTADPIKSTSVESEKDIVFSGSTETVRQVKVRLGQQFFRKVILTSYRRQCCVCGMPIPELLVASHIIPWRDDENLRVNPYNGLCFCASHDKGFDRGLFTLGDRYEVVIGKTIRQYDSNPAVVHYFKLYEGYPITLPDKFIPDQHFLEIHRNHHFVG